MVASVLQADVRSVGDDHSVVETKRQALLGPLRGQESGHPHISRSTRFFPT
jgi:hypothetical protein